MARIFAEGTWPQGREVIRLANSNGYGCPSTSKAEQAPNCSLDGDLGGFTLRNQAGAETITRASENCSVSTWAIGPRASVSCTCSHGERSKLTRYFSALVTGVLGTFALAFRCGGRLFAAQRRVSASKACGRLNELNVVGSERVTRAPAFVDLSLKGQLSAASKNWNRK
jgi:hypothetical protein